MSSIPTASWYAHLPEPKSTPPSITVQELDELSKSGKVAGRDFVVVDVRRTDIDEAGFVLPHSINLPAHSLQATLPVVTHTLAHIPLLVFHCNSCKPGGRGPRSAGWYVDSLTAQGGEPLKQQVYVLEGGYKSWASAGLPLVKAP